MILTAVMPLVVFVLATVFLRLLLAVTTNYLGLVYSIGVKVRSVFCFSNSISSVVLCFY